MYEKHNKGTLNLYYNRLCNLTTSYLKSNYVEQCQKSFFGISSQWQSHEDTRTCLMKLSIWLKYVFSTIGKLSRDLSVYVCFVCTLGQKAISLGQNVYDRKTMK